MARVVLCLFSLLLTEGIYAQHDLQQGLVACYSFSGNAYDGSGNNHHGSVEGAIPTADRFGRPDSAYRFDGLGYISIPSAPVVHNRNFAIAMWAYIDVPPEEYESSTLFSIGFDTDNFHYGVSLSNRYGPRAIRGWTFGGYNTFGSTTATTRPLPDPHTWYHLVMSQTDDSLIVYVNGQRARSESAGVPYFYQKESSIIHIGVRSNFLEPFLGIIDDVAIWDRGLWADEVLELYEQGLSCADIPTPLVGDVVLCGTNIATLEATGQGQYRWYGQPSGGDLLHDGNPFVTPPLEESTSFYVSMVVNGLEGERVKATVTLAPAPELVCNFPEKININTAQNFPVAVTSGTPPYSFTYDFADGTEITTSNSNPIYTYKQEGNYTVTATVEDAMGCKANCAPMIDVRGEIVVPNVITANSDSINRTLTVYYREDNVYYPYSGDSPFSMRIFNRWGEMIFSSTDYASGWRAEDVPAGVYYYRIQLGYEEYKGWLDVLK